MKRREFIKMTAVMSAALAGASWKVEAGTETPVVRKYQAIGSTGLKMSDISIGSVGFTSPSLLLRAIDRGINYIDTSPDYGQAEELIGNVMHKIRREKIILASKFCKTRAEGGHLKLGSSKADYIAAVDASLGRLNTDHLDICFVHSVGSESTDLEREKKRMLDGEMLAAAEALKKAGKVRFLGVSSHGPNNMEELLMIAVRSGHFEVIMPAFNFMKFPDVPGVLEDAREAIEARQQRVRSWVRNLDLLREAGKRGIGVIAMKTLAGEREFDFSSRGEPFQPAAFKWVLGHPEISGIVVTIKTVEQLNLYLRASGERFAAADKRVLDRYAQRQGRTYCRTGCNRCETSCPNGVEIAKVLRYQMYFADYGMEKIAMASYAGLGSNARQCSSCEIESCAGACPYGLTIRALLTGAHKSLTFTA